MELSEWQIKDVPFHINELPIKMFVKYDVYLSKLNNTIILGNTFFQFKQFKVNQEQSAMKVCTDSCIFGAAINGKDCTSILDIGAGTGLLSLMLAQRTDAFIDAVEIDEASANEAKENVTQSPWANRINVFHTSIQNYLVGAEKKYDLIISNPPFYSDSLKSDNDAKNTAHHQTSLSLEELLESVQRLLKPNGRFVVLLPCLEAEMLRENAMLFGLYPSAVLKIKDNAKAKILREVTEFRNDIVIPSLAELTIKEEDGSYTANFVSLLKDYYLHL